MRNSRLVRGKLASGLSSAARGAWLALMGAGALALGAPGFAQPVSQPVQSIDPNSGFDGEPGTAPAAIQTAAHSVAAGADYATPVGAEAGSIPALPAADSGDDGVPTVGAAPQGTIAQQANAADPASTYKEDDLIGAAEGVFGKGAEGVAKMIQGLLKEQGQPNGYIVGREAGGAFVVGLRYGSGTLYHKVEGQRPVYWTGPSIGFDAGANAGNTFVLVYNLYDSQELYKRFPAAEGQAYLVGGLTASYLRQGDVVLIPIRMGVGLRLGINAGYMKFSKKQKWLPF